MKKLTLSVIGVLVIVGGCDLIDGTGIENPNLPIDQAVNLPNAAGPWVNGLNEQMASVMNDYVTTAELATDNYVNVQTFFNQNVDQGTYRDIDDDFDDTQLNIATLREQAAFGLSDVLANDEAAQGTRLEAEMHFYKGYANLLSGELFTALPSETNSAAVPPATHFQNAVTDFNNAININASAPEVVGYRLALARAYYGLGDKTNARAAATAAINADASNSFVRLRDFDGVNGPTNTMQDAVYDRGNFDDLQPLPRLDFLDPKYAQNGDIDSPIPLLKIEEAYLILAEAALSDGNIAEAKLQMQNALDVVNSRPTRLFNETVEQRQDVRLDEGEPGYQRPNASTFDVRFSPDDATAESGYILDRTGSTEVPTISGTSRTAGDIAALALPDEILENIYLMRQEIFFGEGRRMVDLGIRWPVSEFEASNNPAIIAQDRQAVVPGYLPSATEMDQFTVSGSVVTMAVNVNRILAEQRGNKFD